MLRFKTILIILLISYSGVIAQDKKADVTADPDAGTVDSSENNNVTNTTIDTDASVTADENDKKKKKKKSATVNIDAKMLYGQYNNILWLGSITQNFDNFTYQLKSKHKRSNDYGLKNTGFYDNEIGFTGDADITKTWKMTPELEVDNEAHGMYRNPVFSREEKDKVVLIVKNEFKPMPTRWYLNLGGAYYSHRLDTTYTNLVHSTFFYKARAEFAWEYIWSASNKLRFDSKFSQYFYSTYSDHDTFNHNELIYDFKLAEYLMFSLGPIYKYNRDGDHFVSGKIDISTLGIKYFSLEMSYVYDMYPFIPEEYYFEQKFMWDNYSLPPGKGHHAELKMGIDVKRTSKNKFYMKKIKIKAKGVYETNSDYYNYFSLNENVITALPTNVMFVKARGEGAIGFTLASSYLEFGVNYEYLYYRASRRITYHPEHKIEGYMRLSLYRFEFEYNSSLKDRVHVHPYMSIKLNRVLHGYATVQFRVMESFFLYGKVDNIYGSKYSNRYGYSEPGRTVIGGIRILI